MNTTLQLASNASYLETLSQLYTLTGRIQQLEKEHTKEAILYMLQPVREQLRVSPIFRRIQDWPRGYPGDFETIEHLMDCRLPSPAGTFANNLEKWMLTDCAITQQHRNKVNHQSRLMLETILRNTNPQIASLGCGSCADIRSIKNMISGRAFHFDLIDIDEAAIEYSKSQLTELLDRCHFIQGNIYKLVKQMTKSYDLIVIGGVFDYLSDKAIIAIIKKLYFDNLSAGGKLFYTNISEQDPHRIAREYFANWPLIQRSEEDIQRLLQAATIPLTNAHIFKDSTQLTYLVEVVHTGL